MASIDRDYACVMANPTQTISLKSLTWTAVVECTATSAIVENFNASITPEGGDMSYGAAGGTGYTDLYGP
jgi:hypothetical protein